MSYVAVTFPASESPVFNRAWVISAPWAHLAWHSYVFFLYDLTSQAPDGMTPVVYGEGLTHELMVFALDPQYPAEFPFHMLQPANHGYQFKAESNEAAEARIVALLNEIEAMTLSPDTDFRSMWDVRFSDGVSLLNRGGAA